MKEFGITRDDLIYKLKENEIETRPFFPPLNIQPPYITQVKENFPVAEKLFKMGINLPSAVSIKKDEIKFVIDTILSLT
jgi:perosamine synthetase